VQLVREGYVNPQTITGAAGESAAEKRGKQQGFCFRKTRTGRFLPYICWKDGKNVHCVICSLLWPRHSSRWGVQLCVCVFGQQLFERNDFDRNLARWFIFPYLSDI